MESKSKSRFSLRSCLWATFSNTFSYSIVRSTKIHSKSVIIIYRFTQLVILSYIIGYDIIWNKGYQQFDSVTSTVSTKVKGLGYLNESAQSNSTIDNILIFDSADYVIPPNENSAIFIMTNFIETIQTRGVCEAPAFSNAICNEDFDCNKEELRVDWGYTHWQMH